MALSYLKASRCCVLYLQKIVMQQPILSSAKAFPYADFSARTIMSTATLFDNSAPFISVPQIQIDDFEQFVKNKTCVIDVREPQELQETGQIPNSVNIPLGEVQQAFQLPADVFERKYKFSKPAQDQTLVLTCRSGRRSNMACEQLQKLGYDKVINFSEGWLGWEEKHTQQQQQTQ